MLLSFGDGVGGLGNGSPRVMTEVGPQKHLKVLGGKFGLRYKLGRQDRGSRALGCGVTGTRPSSVERVDLGTGLRGAPLSAFQDRRIRARSLTEGPRQLSVAAGFLDFTTQGKVMGELSCLAEGVGAGSGLFQLSDLAVDPPSLLWEWYSYMRSLSTSSS